MHDLADIRRALAILAELIERDGPDYLPLFTRLEGEERKALADVSALARVRAMARGNQQEGQGA